MTSLPYRAGVGAVLFNRRGEVFVARRIDTPGDAWQLPQGGLGKGEEPEAAIFRELAEEIGTGHAEIIGSTTDWLTYDLPEHLLGRVWKGKYRGQRQLWYAMRFLGDDADIDLDATDHPEFDAWRWVPLETLPAAAVPFKRALYDRLVTEFASLAAATFRR